jgi:hypothetical protein
MARLHDSNWRYLLGFLGLAFGIAGPDWGRAAADETFDVPIPKLKKIADSDDDLEKLLKGRFNEAVGVLTLRVQTYQAGRGTFEQVFEAARHVLRSELDLTEKQAEQVAVREKFLTLAKELERIAKLRFEAGQVPKDEVHTAAYWRIDAEIQLVKAKRKAKDQPK